MTELAAPAGLASGPDGSADVVIVCVTHNSTGVIEPFLESMAPALAGLPRCRVVIVDNDSRDGTGALVRRRAPWASVVDSGRNAGYAGGINAALRAHRPRVGAYVLNPDTVPGPGSVKALVDAAARNPSVGIAVPQMLSTSGTPVSSLRREPTIARALGEAVVGGTLASRLAAIGETVPAGSGYPDGARADWATGAALYIPKETLQLVGEWDERYFLYSEETDYCLRVRDAGLQVRLVATARVTHHGGDQSVAPALWAISAVNRTRLYRARHGRWASRAYWSAVLFNEALRSGRDTQTHRTAVRALLAAGPDRPGAEDTLQLLADAGVPLLHHAP